MRRLSAGMTILVAALGFALFLATANAQQQTKLEPPTPTFEDREVLPIKPPWMAPITLLTSS